jgi:outer membrane protein assembly factor BamB
LRKLFLVFFCWALLGPVWAKRQPPPFIPPLDDGIYRFVLRENSQPNKQDIYKGGHVQAYLKATGEMLWEKYLYKVQLDPSVERDVQDVFIREMYLDNPNRLVLENERGEWFILDRRTGDSLQVEDFKPREEEKASGDDDSNKVEPILQDDYLIEADDSVSYGHQKVRAFDVPTGRLLWEKKIPSPRDGNGGRSHISFMLLNPSGQLEITFEDSSECRVEASTGKLLK